MQAQSDRTLSDWLAYIQSVHPRTIDLSLDRPRRVMHQLRPVRPAIVISVAGTNGKGSTAAMLDAVYRAAGYRVGTYTSPHLVQYGERVRINGRDAREDKLCHAFGRVDQARGMIPLTYFEFGTLAALDIFSDSNLDIWILEVGMGGRLDAVNILDPDLAVITSVSMDHEAWLGDSRDAIGKEKAGILRFKGRSVISDPSPPATLLLRLEALDCQARLINRDYRIRNVGKGRWSYTADGHLWPGRSVMSCCEIDATSPVWAQNVAGVLASLRSLNDLVPVDASHLEVLQRFSVPARQQRCPGPVTTWFDVAHNLQAVSALAEQLQAECVQGTTRAVFSMLQDKDIAGTIEVMKGCVDSWYLAELEGPRALGISELRASLSGVEVADLSTSTAPRAVYRAALEDSQPGDRIVVFGSFYLVGDILDWESKRTLG